jgi:hypothetical protein
MSTDKPAPSDKTNNNEKHYFRFLLPHIHLHSTFGDDWFALKAEKFARFFGTPVFLIAQTVVVAMLMPMLSIEKLLQRPVKSVK